MVLYSIDKEQILNRNENSCGVAGDLQVADFIINCTKNIKSSIKQASCISTILLEEITREFLEELEPSEIELSLNVVDGRREQGLACVQSLTELMVTDCLGEIEYNIDNDKRRKSSHNTDTAPKVSINVGAGAGDSTEPKRGSRSRSNSPTAKKVAERVVNSMKTKDNYLDWEKLCRWILFKKPSFALLQRICVIIKENFPLEFAYISEVNNFDIAMLGQILHSDDNLSNFFWCILDLSENILIQSMLSESGLFRMGLEGDKQYFIISEHKRTNALELCDKILKHIILGDNLPSGLDKQKRMVATSTSGVDTSKTTADTVTGQTNTHNTNEFI